MGRLQDKVAVITGASSGIGLATARRFAQERARVFMMGRRPAELEQAVRHVGHGAVGVPGDVSSQADLDGLYDRVGRDAGALDILFANAGGGTFLSLGHITEEHYER
ncbi:SDR family NAD(P)-dependent oxidoreductase, partial [Nostoc sp. NIES-2111]